MYTLGLQFFHPTINTCTYPSEVEPHHIHLAEFWTWWRWWRSFFLRWKTLANKLHGADGGALYVNSGPSIHPLRVLPFAHLVPPRLLDNTITAGVASPCTIFSRFLRWFCFSSFLLFHILLLDGWCFFLASLSAHIINFAKACVPHSLLMHDRLGKREGPAATTATATAASASSGFLDGWRKFCERMK